MREVEQLTLEQLCGQLLVVGFAGHTVSPSIASQLRRRALGGLILFSRNLPQLGKATSFAQYEAAWRLCRELADLAEEGGFTPFLGVDQEGGRVRRIREGVLQLPPMSVLGQVDDLELTRELAQQLAQELVLAGFNINFAPVVDVDSNPQNPVIGDRSFSASPQVVTRHAKAVVEGLQSHGLMACLKHFPGHGDTSQDSHLSLPIVKRSTLQLRQVEMYPFERLARHSAAVMSAHVVFEGLDSAPATLSARLLQDLLRSEFGFEGVIFSDDLEMGALANAWPIEETCVRAVEAGCDALLICESESLQARAKDALMAKASTSSTFRARCVEAVSNSLSWRRKFPPRPAQRKSELEALLGSQKAVRARERLEQLTLQKR
ncbi:MAG: hypothetical protein RJA70_1865 [Pseudomonadota bacterium]|jgi:beta-N-acetylhexosaminidase